MPSTRFEEARDYAFADQALALRARAHLTQRELAARLGVSARAIGAWEAGLAYPTIARLKDLIALYPERGASERRARGIRSKTWRIVTKTVVVNRSHVARGTTKVRSADIMGSSQTVKPPHAAGGEV